MAVYKCCRCDFTYNPDDYAGYVGTWGNAWELVPTHSTPICQPQQYHWETICPGSQLYPLIVETPND